MPLISHRESAAPLEMKSLVEEARKAVEGDLSADAHAKAALANIIRVGISAGGARQSGRRLESGDKSNPERSVRYRLRVRTLDCQV